MKILLYLFLLLTSCTAPSIPGIITIDYLVDEFSPKSDNTIKDEHICACKEEKKSSERVYCREVDGRMIVSPEKYATHICCFYCMSKCSTK